MSTENEYLRMVSALIPNTVLILVPSLVFGPFSIATVFDEYKDVAE